MSPEVQNRINEVKFECAGDVATLKKVNGIETALRWAQRGVLARGVRYVFAFFVMIIAILIMAWGGLDKNVITPYVNMLVEKPQYKEAVFLDGLENNKKVYSQNKKAKEKYSFKRSIAYSTFHFGIPFLLITFYELFIVAPRRKQLAKLGEQGFLRQYARSNGLPENLFDVKRG